MSPRMSSGGPGTEAAVADRGRRVDERVKRAPRTRDNRRILRLFRAYRARLGSR